jgi:hypothetical protein
MEEGKEVVERKPMPALNPRHQLAEKGLLDAGRKMWLVPKK